MKPFLLPVILIVFFSSCGLTKIDPAEAKTLVESLLNDLKSENYSSLDKYYTSSFNRSEPLDNKIDKFRRLKDTIGAMKSFELISSKEIYDSEQGINQLELKYKIVCSRATVEETFLLIKDEGALKIIFQNIENSTRSETKK